jgi:predicted HNH restriction endonuclease
MEALAYNESNLMALCSECHRMIHRKMGKGHINEAHRHRLHNRLSKEHIKEAMENDINDFIERIKNGI